MQKWQNKFEEWWHGNESDDASHDLGHFRRVYKMAIRISEMDQVDADPLVLMAAAYFHDVVNPPKDSDLRSQASRLAAEKTREILREMNFPPEKIDGVAHAVLAHSFSAAIPAETIEAKVIQDADRMESLGAMGVARNMYVSGRMGSSMFHPDDPMAESDREYEDSRYALDHYELKLFKLPEMMQTPAGQKIAQERVQYLREYQERLRQEILGEV